MLCKSHPITISWRKSIYLYVQYIQLKLGMQILDIPLLLGMLHKLRLITRAIESIGVLTTAVLQDCKPLFILSRDKLFLFILRPVELRAEAGLKTSKKPPGTSCPARLQ